MKDYIAIVEKLRSEVRINRYKGTIDDILSFVETNSLYESFVENYNKLLDNNFHYYDALVNTYSKLKREVDNNLN